MTRIKQIIWDSSTLPEIRKEEYHSMLLIDDGETAIPKVGEPIQLSVREVIDKEPVNIHIGCGEVVSLKHCYLNDLEKQDLLRNRNGCKTRVASAHVLSKGYPNLVIKGNTEVIVVTIRRFDYDLGKLRNGRKDVER